MLMNIKLHRRIIGIGILALLAASAGIEPAAGQGFGGPSMLSRGGNRPGQRGTAPVNLTYYGSVRGIYETGLLPVALDQEGELPDEDAIGTLVEAGLYGTKSWRNSILGVDFRGDYRYSDNAIRRNFSGSNYALSVDYEYTASKRLVLFGRETAGTTNRAFGSFSAPAFADTDNLGVPLDELFDTRVYYTQTTGSAAFRKSARTTLVASGDYFAIKRPDQRLTSVTGKRAVGVYQYQLNRRTTVGALFQYMRFTYPRAYGQADATGYSTVFRRTFGRSIQTKLIAGVLRIEAIGNQQVTLSPEIARILGRTTAIEAFHRVSYGRHLDASIEIKQQRGSFRAGYTSGVMPGNGLYLVSVRDAVNAGYSYSGIRKLSLGASAGWSRIQSRATQLSETNLWRFGGAGNYKLADHIDLSLQADKRTFDSPGLIGRSGVMISFGVSVSPSRLPLSIW